MNNQHDSFCLFRRIGHRVLLLVGVVVLCGLGITLGMFVTNEEKTALAQNERVTRLMTRSVTSGLQTVMLAGYADIAQRFANNLKSVHGIDEFLILRRNGQEAFRDNHTIHEINERLGGNTFQERTDEALNQVLAADRSELQRVLASGDDVSIYHTDDNGNQVLTFLTPIENQPQCHGCHGDQHRVQGVLMLTTSLAGVMHDVETSVERMVVVMVITALAILVVIFWVIRKSVVAPIARVTNAMSKVAEGQLQERVPDLGCDELHQMANSFNTMTAKVLESYTGLQSEQNKLTTIILSAREGIVVTNRDGDVVLVNPAAERLLGKRAELIIAEGFLNLIDDAAYLRAYLAREGQGIPETVVFNNRVINLHAATIYNSEGGAIGSAALLRDVTEEKNLESQLRMLSNTDGLTGLFNRRRMDEILTEELGRAKRYGLALTFMLFDVDHFKRFNDQYGHDQGDRVLQAIGGVMKEHFRDVDYPCRYGGEEFCAILPSTGMPGAKLAAERLRQKVEGMAVDGLKVTISIGVAVYPHPVATSADELIKLADQALYAAKEAGRNRVMLAGYGVIRGADEMIF